MEMEPQPQTTPEVTPAPTSPSPNTPASEPTQTPASPEPVAPTPEAPPVPSSVQANPYTPTLKYNFDKKEYDFDPIFKEMVKSKETEEKLRDLYTRSHGMDQYKTELQQYQAGISELKKHYAREDFDSLFKTLNIPEEKIVDWLVKKAQYLNQSPEERQKLDRMRAAETRSHQLADETETLKTQYQQMLQQSFQREMELALNQPEVKKFEEQMNARAGTPDAFWKAVKDYGEMVYYRDQRSVSPFEAVKAVMDFYGKFVAPEPAKEAAPALAHPGNGKEPPVLPNLAGNKSSSPTQKKAKSVEDLRAAYQKMI